MKIITQLFCFSALVCLSLPVFSQKYKTIKDTARLNKEYVSVSNEIADLNAKLTIAQNDLPAYQSKAKNANDDAANAATESSEQASKATNGSLRDAKKAKRKAKQAYNDAKDSKSAKGKIDNQENKITRYQLVIKKKQQRIEELEVMRSAINAKALNDTIPHL